MADFKRLKSQLEEVGLTCSSSNTKDPNDICFEIRTIYNKTKRYEAQVFYVKLDPGDFDDDDQSIKEGYHYYKPNSYDDEYGLCRTVEELIEVIKSDIIFVSYIKCYQEKMELQAKYDALKAEVDMIPGYGVVFSEAEDHFKVIQLDQ